MALDKLVDSTQLDSDLTSVANAIRTKGGTSASLEFPGDFVTAIGNISGGGATLVTKSISANGTYNASSDSADGYSQVTVNVPTGTARTSSDLTASNLTVTAPAGLYASAASKTLTDANLTAGNIKKDVTIFGTTGTYEGGGGGTNYLNYCTNIKFGANFPSATPSISLPEVNDLAELFYHSASNYAYTSISVTFGKQITSVNRAFGNYFNATHGLTSVTINGDLSKVTNYTDFVKGHADLTEVKGSPLDFSSVTNANWSGWGPNSTATTYAITYVRYVANSLKVNQSLAAAPSLSNDSIVSIANGLNDSVTGKTITLHSTVSGKLSTIYGTVSGGVFTETGNSNDTTLLSFITNTKGWTVA